MKSNDFFTKYFSPLSGSGFHRRPRITTRDVKKNIFASIFLVFLHGFGEDAKGNFGVSPTQKQ